MSPRRERPTPVRTVDDLERRTRLARRHGLAVEARASDVVAATRAMTVLHATEPASVHLALRARVHHLVHDDVERALYDERSIVKVVCMRRTQFGVPRDLLNEVWGSSGRRVAGSLGNRLAKDVVAAGLAGDGHRWIAETGDSVVEVLADGTEADARVLSERVPALKATVERSPGTKWGATVSVASQLLPVLAAEGRIVRAHNGGHWRLSRPRWTATAAWLGTEPDPTDERTGYAEVVRRWLRTFGPGTEEDLRWWLGGTLGAVRGALDDLAAVPVAVDGGIGWLLPDDVDPPEPVAPWAALTPTLDPTVMGWKDRRFYLGGLGPELTDSVGNVGTTAWWDGRVVGCWVQDADQRVVVQPIGDVPRDARRALAAEAERLTTWLDGVRIVTLYVSAAMADAARTAGVDQS